MTTGENENAPAAETVAPAQTTEPSPTKVKAKAKSVKKKKAKKSIPTDSQFAAILIETLYALRRNNPTKWVDLRNGTKEGEQLHKMLLGRPTYKWKLVGLGHYLESVHDGSETIVAYVLPHDPMSVYRSELRTYQEAMQRRKSKSLVEPKKPESKKKTFRWVITNRRGVEEHDGHEATLDAAKEIVLSKTHLFAV